MIFVVLLTLFLMGATPAWAGPRLYFTPASGTVAVGETIKVSLGVDSGTESSQAVDAWATFDAAKLEVLSIEKSANPPESFSYAIGHNIYNSQGKFDVTFGSTDAMSGLEAKPIVGDLAVITFKAKSEGVAAVNLTCAAGSTIDTNIFNMSAVDVIDCPSNGSASFTVGAASNNTTTTTTSTPTPTTVASELPQTGVFGPTLGVVLFGVLALGVGLLFGIL